MKKLLELVAMLLASLCDKNATLRNRLCGLDTNISIVPAGMEFMSIGKCTKIIMETFHRREKICDNTFGRR